MAPVSTSGAAAQGAPGTPLPQEIKIQIKLPKPGTASVPSLTAVQSPQPLIGQPMVQFPPAPGMPFGSPPPASGTPPIPGVQQPMGSPDASAHASGGSVSVVRQLALGERRRHSLQPSRSHDAVVGTTPLVVVDPPPEELQNATLVELSATPPAPPHHDAASR